MYLRNGIVVVGKQASCELSEPYACCLCLDPKPTTLTHGIWAYYSHWSPLVVVVEVGEPVANYLAISSGLVDGVRIPDKLATSVRFEKPRWELMPVV